MKVIAFNGSARKGGNTADMINVVFKELEAEGIETELLHIGGKPAQGCIACMKCFKNKDRKCALTKDPMNDYITAMAEADGVILASPTYFANVTTEMKALIDRAGMVARTNGDMFARKVGAGVVARRRGGAMQAFNALNTFFFISQMVVPGSRYWNMGSGMDKGEVMNDAEAIETMEFLGKNMAWLMKKIAD